MLFTRSAPYRIASLYPLALIAIFVLLAGTGCINHAPMSETVMFREPGTSPRHTAIPAVGATLSVPVSGRQKMLSERLPDRSNADLWSEEPNGGVYLALYDPQGRFAASATAGYFVAGLDATVQLLPAMYLTGSISHRSGQLYLQRRIYNHRALGAAIGAGYQRVNLVTSDHDNSAMFAIDEIPVDVIGIRPHALFRMTDQNNIGMRVSMFGGIATQTQDPYVTLSLTMGGF